MSNILLLAAQLVQGYSQHSIGHKTLLMRLQLRLNAYPSRESGSLQ
ncbi:MAG: hypothetical protein ACSLEL_01940 [Candidatus Malihini olakiniferum]